MSRTYVNNNIKLEADNSVVIKNNGITTSLAALSSLPTYENLTAGDLLKVVNDGGTYKLKKIEGINDGTSFQTSQYAPTIAKGVKISNNKIVLVYALNQLLYLRTLTISGKTITDDNNQTSCNGTSITEGYLFDVKKVANNKFIVAYSIGYKSTYARVGSVSETTITMGTETELETYPQSTSNSSSITIEEVETNKFVCAYSFMNTNNYYVTNARLLMTSDANNNITVGNYVGLQGGSSPFFCRLIINKIDTNVFAVSGLYYNDDDSKYYLASRIVSVSGTNITTSSLLLTFETTASNMHLTAKQYDINKFFILYTYSTNNRISFMTWSGGAITETRKNSSLSIGSVQNTIGKNENYYYYLDNSSTISKFMIDETTGTTTIKTYTKPQTIGGFIDFDNFFIFLNDYNISGGNSTNMVGTMLLDHDKFITSANKSYTAGDNVPITNVFTGFSGLNGGMDYYINSTGNGITINNTYQKIGKAINDTTIIKS